MYAQLTFIIFVRTENDPWDWLAKLMNILEELDDKSIQLENEMKEGKHVVMQYLKKPSDNIEKAL